MIRTRRERGNRRSFFQGPGAAARCRRQRPLNLEALEDRTLPSFLPAVTYDTGRGPASVAVGDFNEDGIPDLAVADLTSGRVSVLLGNGDGSFQAAVYYPVGQDARYVAVGDFNEDGHLDLVVANHGGDATFAGSVSILVGNGDGTFQDAINYAVGNGPDSIAVGDFYGDGHLDVVTANDIFGHASNLSLLRGNGDGTFQPAVTISAGLQTVGVAVGDFNGDGHLDLVVGNRAPNTVTVLLGNGDGTFQAPVAYPTGAEPFSIAVGDFNNDGVPDLAVANRSGNNVSILLGNGDGTFQDAVNYSGIPGPWSVAAADFNGDGNLDLAVASNTTGSATVLLGNGDGTFQAPLSYPTGTEPFSVAVGDFNCDGAPDLAVADKAVDNVAILLNAGDWTSAPDSAASFRRGRKEPFTPFASLLTAPDVPRPIVPRQESTPSISLESVVDSVWAQRAAADSDSIPPQAPMHPLPPAAAGLLLDSWAVARVNEPLQSPLLEQRG